MTAPIVNGLNHAQSFDFRDRRQQAARAQVRHGGRSSGVDQPARIEEGLALATGR